MLFKISWIALWVAAIVPAPDLEYVHYVEAVLICPACRIAAAEGRATVAEPPYAKWGRLAMRETARRYPDADITDYHHVGRRLVGRGVAEETFRLWLVRRGTGFRVEVVIRIEIPSERLIDLRFVDGG